MSAAPVITGDRVRLRPHVIDDMEAFWAFYQSPRAQFMDRPNNRTHLWYGFASEVGSWTLTGMGGWGIDVEGAFAGQIAIIHPPHFEETELGWFLLEGFEGKGIGFEAARLALDYARNHLKPASLVSYIHRDNTRSIALAKRLGGTHDPAGKTHDADDVVYRYEVAA
ncbi:GNAT family N-acetyltransferase [Roseobacter sinensis]|uniref:GNAT family N-acetyltransferase n=1 Tax=Roseobacter sinensis TaxID=2931391 RepID=A0ABT3BE02_9RHOB|nr:GNAT family N-acetyltransferase [Roseobacter sp. WL0113]MCV3271782.1 GNAT family N-acetyltransferase [Roseobacter sp. WL0113]